MTRITHPEYGPDNVDRMLVRVLEETLSADPWRREQPVVIVNDLTGALSQWAQEQQFAARFIQDSAALHQEHAEVTGPVSSVVDAQTLRGAGTVVVRLARPLEALEELAWHVARWASADVMMLAGQLQRHLSYSMNTVLEQFFDDVTASRGYFKSRALRAQVPKALVGDTPPRMPRQNLVHSGAHDLHLRAYGLTFGAARLDQGTRLLLDTLRAYPPEQFTPEATVVDLGCGNGTIAASLAQHFEFGRLVATDDSASAVASTTATLAANELSQIDVMHQSGLVGFADNSVDAVVLNPPFHDGTQVTSDIAFYLFDEVARALKPGGILLTVFNAARHYRPQLEYRVGPTWQLARDKRFIVTQSQKVSEDV